MVTFLPVTTVWRGVNAFRRVKVQRSYPLMVRWLFAGFPDTPDWYWLGSLGDVTGVAGMGVTPIPIRGADVERLAREHDDGMFNAPLEHRWMKTRGEFKKGDLVRVVEGPLADRVVHVHEIEGHRAKVMMEFFGLDKEVELELGILEKADVVED